MAATRKPLSPSAAAGGDHLRFLRPGALARLRDARLRRRSLAPRVPPTASPEPEPTSPPPATTGTGDGAGMVVPYFVPASRLMAPRCPQRKKMTAAKSAVLLSPPPLPSPDLTIEAVVEFLNQPDMVVAAH